MKKVLLCIASAMMLLAMPTYAQSNNNVDEVVKIERHAARDYREGEMIVKFKATSPVRVKAIGKKLTSGVSQVDRVFEELGVSAGEQLMPLTGAQKANRTKALKSVTGQIIPDADMTLLYRLQFDPKQMDVHLAIEKVKALDEVEYAEPNYLVYALSSDDGVLHHHDDFDHYSKEPLYPEQWGHHPLKTPFLWQQPKITDEDRQPTLGLVTYVLKDTIQGDGDGRPDAGEIIALYPTFRNEWGLAKNIRFSLEVAETEDPTIIEVLDSVVDFGKPLSSYGKNISANPLRFKVREDCADGRHICLVLRATCDNIAEELVHEFTITAENGVEIGGVISQNTTLYPNVHYIVTQSLAIPEGVTLTIRPGTVLRFKEDVAFRCEGRLKCCGTPDSMVVFTMATGCFEWGGFVSSFRDTLEYVKFCDIEDEHGVLVTYQYFDENNNHIYYSGTSPINGIFKNSIIEHINTGEDMSNWGATVLEKSNIIHNYFFSSSASFGKRQPFYDSNIAGNQSTGANYRYSNLYAAKNCNVLSNTHNGEIQNTACFFDNIFVYKNDAPIYWGSSREDIVRKGIVDMNHSKGSGFGVVDLSNMLSRPSAEAHGIVWKVVVNGFDAQDEFEQLPPLGVGKHKFEVYFNRPMDVSKTPMLTMGVRPPYTQHTIAEEGFWSEDSLVYTAYLTITGKTNTDGLNRIYVAEAEDNEHFEIPVENMRFNVEVAAAGSMATGLMAEAGLGKVTLTWETDEEDFADLLGYNIYRYTLNDSGVSSDSIVVNSNVLEAEETTFTDYNVVPGTTYYYVIKQLTTSLTSHALSNAVAATPLTAQKGDANGSMNVDIADVVTEVSYITYQDPQPFIFEAADVNSDEKVNVLDVVGTIGIITNPTQTGVNAMDDTPVHYYVQDGVLYMENTQPLGGVQVLLNADKGTAIKALDGVKGMEQNGTWMSDSEYLFLAYSMSGRTIAPGTHALLEIGKTSCVTEVILSDAKGHNVMAINGNATGVGKVEAMQMQMPTPNPFTTMLKVPYVIGQDGNHSVSLVFTDMTGRTLDAYHTVADKGVYTYTWYPKGLNQGLYLVSMYVDGKLMQTAKVICAGK